MTSFPAAAPIGGPSSAAGRYPRLDPSAWQPHRPPHGPTWADFTAWVDWVDTAYELDLPGCWTRHEGLVHTLAGLWHMWRVVYAQANPVTPPAPVGPASWHHTYLYPFRDRVHSGEIPGGKCRSRTHRPYSREHELDADIQTRWDALSNGTDADLTSREADAATRLAVDLGDAAIIGVLYPTRATTSRSD